MPANIWSFRCLFHWAGLLWTFIVISGQIFVNKYVHPSHSLRLCSYRLAQWEEIVAFAAAGYMVAKRRGTGWSKVLQMSVVEALLTSRTALLTKHFLWTSVTLLFEDYIAIKDVALLHFLSRDYMNLKMKQLFFCIPPPMFLSRSNTKLSLRRQASHAVSTLCVFVLTWEPEELLKYMQMIELWSSLCYPDMMIFHSCFGGHG